MTGAQIVGNDQRGRGLICMVANYYLSNYSLSVTCQYQYSWVNQSLPEVKTITFDNHIILLLRCPWRRSCNSQSQRPRSITTGCCVLLRRRYHIFSQDFTHILFPKHKSDQPAEDTDYLCFFCRSHNWSRQVSVRSHGHCGIVTGNSRCVD